MSQFYHIPNKNLYNIDLEDLYSEYSSGDLVLMTESGCSLVSPLDNSVIEQMMQDYVNSF